MLKWNHGKRASEAGEKRLFHWVYREQLKYCVQQSVLSFKCTLNQKGSKVCKVLKYEEGTGDVYFWKKEKLQHGHEHVLPIYKKHPENDSISSFNKQNI